MKIIPTDEQEQMLDNMVHWYNYDSHNKPYYSYSGRAGTGKEQPDSTMIPTPIGMRRLDELEIGDEVFNLYGKPTKITGIFPQGIKDVYEITFGDGRRSKCGLDHNWTVITQSHGKDKWKVKTTRELLVDWEKHRKGSDRTRLIHKYSIPMNSSVEYHNLASLSIDPYVIGILIGNGCLRETELTISSGNDDTINEILKIYDWLSAEKVHDNNYSYIFRYNHGERVQLKEFLANIPELIGTYSHEKSIPHEYLYASVDDRMSLLQGLMDSNGSIGKKTYSVRYTTVSKQLKDDICQLVWSLGIRCGVSEDVREGKYENSDGICYNISINCPNTIKPYLFRIWRKRQIALMSVDKKIKKRYDRITITNIQKLDYQESQRCITVDNPLHIYLTEDFVPTHNTMMIKLFMDRMGFESYEIATVAYIGKAVARMISLGNKGASTIHKLIYNVDMRYVKNEDGKIIKREPFFILKQQLDNPYIRIIHCDEALMVDDELISQLLSFGIPVIFSGDRNQLQPIFGYNSVLTKPDFTLTKIMRQEEESMIVQLASEILFGKKLSEYPDGIFKEITFRTFIDVDKKLSEDYDAIMTSRNKTREDINNAIVTDLYGGTSKFPYIGSKLVSRNNDWNIIIDDKYYLTNGTTGYVLDTNMRGKSLRIDFLPDYLSNEGYPFFDRIRMDVDYFKADYRRRNEWGYTKWHKFEYGYCLSVHLMQGSEASKVLFIDDINSWDKEYYKKLAYTAITRAMDHITIVKGFS